MTTQVIVQIPLGQEKSVKCYLIQPPSGVPNAPAEGTIWHESEMQAGDIVSFNVHDGARLVIDEIK